MPNERSHTATIHITLAISFRNSTFRSSKRDSSRIRNYFMRSCARGQRAFERYVGTQCARRQRAFERRREKTSRAIHQKAPRRRAAQTATNFRRNAEAIGRPFPGSVHGPGNASPWPNYIFYFLLCLAADRIRHCGSGGRRRNKPSNWLRIAANTEVSGWPLPPPGGQ